MLFVRSCGDISELLSRQSPTGLLNFSPVLSCSTKPGPDVRKPCQVQALASEGALAPRKICCTMPRLAHMHITLHIILLYLQVSKAFCKLQVCLEPADQGRLCFSSVASSSHQLQGAAAVVASVCIPETQTQACAPPCCLRGSTIKYALCAIPVHHGSC